MNDLARRDLFICLGVWLALETVCFAVMPALKFSQPENSTNLWFAISLPFGIGGAFLTASSTQLLSWEAEEPIAQAKKSFSALLSVLTSWLGLVGISFPLLIISLQICDRLFAIIKQ